eukprot:4145600-Pyramimonas_sp.AAC.1
MRPSCAISRAGVQQLCETFAEVRMFTWSVCRSPCCSTRRLQRARVNSSFECVLRAPVLRLSRSSFGYACVRLQCERVRSCNAIVSCDQLGHALQSFPRRRLHQPNRRRHGVHD